MENVQSDDSDDYDTAPCERRKKTSVRAHNYVNRCKLQILKNKHRKEFSLQMILFYFFFLNIYLLGKSIHSR